MGDEELKIDHHHPLYLQPSDTPGVTLIDFKLTRPENYGLWSRSMRMTLLAKNKLRFIKGTYVKSLYKGALAEQWCNDPANEFDYFSPIFPT